MNAIKKSSLILLTMLCLAHSGLAAEVGKGQEAYIDANSNRAMVPLRWVSEKLGASVKWEASKQEVLILQTGNKISLKIGSKQAYVNGNSVFIDQSAVLKNNVTFVPLRFVSESMGVNVRWVKDLGLIELSTKEATVHLQLTSSVDPPEESYANDRFSHVKVIRVGEDRYQVSGEAKVTDGRVQYVVEDGHNELLKGSVAANRSAPEWGTFEMEVSVKKAQENSTLTLILFEQGTKDGRRLSELPISLP